MDETGKVKGWIDASERGSGNWMKYIRSAADKSQLNVMAVQVQDQVRQFLPITVTNSYIYHVGSMCLTTLSIFQSVNLLLLVANLVNRKG